MDILPWLTLDALQSGALLALAAIFGADALHRRDRMMGWLALCCLFVAARHGVGILDLARVLSVEEGDRLQSALGALGFMAMARALFILFPDRYPRWFFPAFVAGSIPNLLRCTFLPLDGTWARAFHAIALLTYLGGCLLTAWVLFGASRSKDPLGVRLLAGLIATMLPVVVEVLARLVYGTSVRVSGVSIMLMSITVGVSWVWVQTQDLQARRDALEAEVGAWRSLMPGPTWDASEGSPLLDHLLGPHWIQKVGERVLGRDGRPYLLRGQPLPDGTWVGWLEALQAPVGSDRPFLQGWTVALGLDDPETTEQVRKWLEEWGAQVVLWGTVPPREGPFPSFILWGREPSILSVWRADDWARRRCRWIQWGGYAGGSPHARVEGPLDAEGLRAVLQRFVGFQQIHDGPPSGISEG